MRTLHETTENGAVPDRAGSVPRFTALDGFSDESRGFRRWVKPFDDVGILKADGLDA
jgi:hypothetical protein